MTTAKELQKSLTWEFPHIGKAEPAAKTEAFAYCEGYKDFLNEGKTEREFAAKAVELLQAAGYEPLDLSKQYKPGDKVYYVNRGKSLAMSTFGVAPLEKGVRLNAAHIDSPRLDLKPNPVYEKNDIAYFKTHYYGGIRKYQWVTTPLAMHGVIVKKDGTIVKVSVGEKAGEPQFCVTDLLPHLGAKQNERKLSDGIRGEELNIVIGSLPFVSDDDKEEVKNAVKLTALSLLNEMYGITEHDFMRAEIEFVPAVKAVDIGLDRSLIGAYGQDDKICAWTSLFAMLNVENPTRTSCTLLVDKEEIGSVGASGMHSHFFENMLAEILYLMGKESDIAVRRTLAHSTMLSSDVSAGFDPLFPDKFEAKNSAFLGKGIVFNKFTGSRGKSGSNDANAEYMAKIRKVMDDNNVAFQTAELGKVDVGGGGTIAYIMANYGMEVIDAGLAVLCMHSPAEISSKADVYEAVRAYEAFLRDMK